MRKPTFCICENKDADQRLCFRYTDSTIPLHLFPRFQASSFMLLLYSLVCVGPGRKPKLFVFSCTGSNVFKGIFSWLSCSLVDLHSVSILRLQSSTKGKPGQTFKNDTQTRHCFKDNPEKSSKIRRHETRDNYYKRWTRSH